MKSMYTDKTRYNFIKILEKDIRGIAYNSVILKIPLFIPGFDVEDIQQELRLFLWTYDYTYNPHKAAIRTWGNLAIRAALKNLYVAHCETDKRKINSMLVEYDDSKDQDYEED